MSMEKYFYLFLIIKSSSDLFQTQLFGKVFLYFDILTWSSTLNLGSFSLFFLSKSMHVLDVTQTGFTLIMVWYVFLHLLSIAANLSIYAFYDTDWSHVFVSFLLNCSDKSFSNNRFSFIMCWIHFYIYIF